MITIEVDGIDEVNRRLTEYARRGHNLAPVLADIGEHMISSVKDNFESSTAPDGTPWASNSAVTFASMLGKSHHRKDGRINKRGVNKVMSKMPLIGESRELSNGIRYQINGNTLMVGTDAPYGTTQHYGAKQGQFGTNKRGVPLPWGDIPARPFLGAKEADKPILEKKVADYLMNG